MKTLNIPTFEKMRAEIPEIVSFFAYDELATPAALIGLIGDVDDVRVVSGVNQAVATDRQLVMQDADQVPNTDGDWTLRDELMERFMAPGSRLSFQELDIVRAVGSSTRGTLYAIRDRRAIDALRDWHRIDEWRETHKLHVEVSRVYGRPGPSIATATTFKAKVRNPDIPYAKRWDSNYMPNHSSVRENAVIAFLETRGARL
ncbi:MAG: hypothetical protein ACI9T8_000331 [Candidatus Saccharimonadales bacterium]|jgi:hypothetical protein